MNPKYSSLVHQAKQISMRDIMTHFNVSFDKSFSYLIHCPFPFHSSDSTPSFKVYEDTNSFFCFGCKSAGGPHHFTKYMLGTTMEGALDYLQKHFNLKSKSLADSFNKMSKNIQSFKPTVIDPAILIGSYSDKIASLTQCLFWFNRYSINFAFISAL